MSLLLIVRSADDVRSAVEAANEFLVHLRRRFPEPREVDEVLGLWLRRELDADLPAWLWLDRERGLGMRVDAPAGETPGQGPREADVGVRESFSLSGLWSLCWIDGTLLRESKSPEERRRRILDALVRDAAAEAASQPGAFFPVFEATEPLDLVDENLRQLRDRYPHLVGGRWFVDDRERGIVGPRGGR
jgi:hypothetical protein